MSRRPLQNGHPVPPDVRFEMVASHSCPFVHIHHAFFAEKAETSDGSFEFLLGCH